MNNDSKAAALILDAMLSGFTGDAQEGLAALGYTPEEQSRWLGRTRRELEDIARAPEVRPYVAPDRQPIELPGDMEESAFQAVLAAAMPRHQPALIFWRWSSRPKEEGTRRAVLLRYALELLHPGPGPADMSPADCEARFIALPDETKAAVAAHKAAQAAQEARFKEWQASEEGIASKARWYKEHGMEPPEPVQAPQSPAIEAAPPIDTTPAPEPLEPAKATQAAQTKAEAEAASYAAAEAEIEAQISPPGLETVLAFAARGFPLMGCYASGATYRSGDDYRNGFTNDAGRIQDLWTGKGDAWGHGKGSRIQLYRFEPGQGGFICLDLDRNHKDGKDGLQELVNVFRANGLPLPGIFKDLEGGSFPCYTLTPSGGMHLYFRYRGIRQYIHQYPAPAVELFHFGSTLAAPGSIKEGKGGYTLMGSLDDAPLFPGALERLLKLPKDDPGNIAEFSAQPLYSTDRPSLETMLKWADKNMVGKAAPEKARRIIAWARKEHYADAEISATLKAAPLGLSAHEIEDEMNKRPGLDDLAKWAESKASGRHDLCLYIAGAAHRLKFPPDEVKAFLRTYAGTAGHDQIDSTVESFSKQAQGGAYR